MSILNPSYQEEKGFPGGPDSTESSCNAGHPGLITGSGRSPGEGLLTSVFLPGKFYGQRSLASYIQSTGSKRVRHDWKDGKINGKIKMEKLDGKINLISLWKLED